MFRTVALVSIVILGAFGLLAIFYGTVRLLGGGGEFETMNLIAGIVYLTVGVLTLVYAISMFRKSREERNEDSETDVLDDDFLPQ